MAPILDGPGDGPGRDLDAVSQHAGKRITHDADLFGQLHLFRVGQGQHRQPILFDVDQPKSQA